MLSLDEALKTLLPAIKPLECEKISLGQAFGRILAAEVTSAVDLPPFDNSSMDGYAVRAESLTAASEGAPVTLQVLGRVAAGESFDGIVGPGQCVRVFTGSPLPKGADAVIMQEATRIIEEGSVEALESVEPWENVRFKGEDLKGGAPVAQPGMRIDAGLLGLLGASGISDLNVAHRPRIALLATGSELREPGQPISGGQIYESNRVMLSALCEQTGCPATILPILADDAVSTRSALADAFSQYDVVITSGGVSVGEHDFVKSSFEAIGGEIAFWRVAIRPGKPFVFGKLGDKYLFGLPGNPVSSFVTFLLLVRPSLLQMQSAAEIQMRIVQGILAHEIVNANDRAHYVRVKLNSTGEVRSTGKQASHVLTSLSQANALLEVPPQRSFKAGEVVKVLLWS